MDRDGRFKASIGAETPAMSPPQTESHGLTVTRIEALGFRTLRYVSQRLGPFHVLVGPNASGKSAFLDVLAFLGDLHRVDLEHAIMGYEPFGIPRRATDPRHLTWMRRGKTFELAVEAAVPDVLRERLQNGAAGVCRYEIAVDVTEPYHIVRETLWLKPEEGAGAERERPRFPDPPEPPEGIVVDPEKRAAAGWRRVIFRESNPGQATFRSEVSSRRSFRFRIPTGKSVLDSLPPDDFPVAERFQQMLAKGVQRIALAGGAMRRTSPPGKSDAYVSDGSNLPHVVDTVMRTASDRYADWMMHVREALPDIKGITTRMQPWDGHRYLMVHYRNGLEVPSWLVSDGTLRFLALTLLAYLHEPTGPYLIEEPENGIHPRAVETVFQSLSSVYDAQILLATHSPDITRLASVDQMLCFARSEKGGTDIVAGSAHPRLRDWPGIVDLGLLLGSGVLG